MKKSLSLIITLAMLAGMLASFSVVTGADTVAESEPAMYSGGSGTKDDPYLISRRGDIIDMQENIINNKYSWGNKVYYKLTNDIRLGVNHGGDFISPIYYFSKATIESIPDCPYVQTDSLYATYFCDYPYAYGFKASDLDFEYDPDRAIRKSLGEGHEIIVGYEGEDQYTEEFKRKVAEEWGPMYFTYGVYRSSVGSGAITSNNNGTKMLETLNDYFFYTSYEQLNQSSDYRESAEVSYIYRAIVFSGVFDGNGHTITIVDSNSNSQYLFGFLENGAEIKNLTLKGKNARLAAYVGENCKITNCTFGTADDTNKYTTAPITKNLGTVSGCTNYTSNREGIVGQNEGIINNCINYGNITSGNFYGQGETDVKGCVDFSGSIDSTPNGILSAEEIELHTGNISAFTDAGLDLYNVWVIKDGIPLLRSQIPIGTGDVDLDGITGTIDANILQRYISGANINIVYTNPHSADMNSDGKLNAMDSAILKRMFVG